jgi:hypothetical protein
MPVAWIPSVRVIRRDSHSTPFQTAIRTDEPVSTRGRATRTQALYDSFLCVRQRNSAGTPSRKDVIPR